MATPGREGPNMKAVMQSLLFLLLKATDHDLARQLQYLKVENDILRAKLPKRIQVTARERKRLLKFGKPLGKALRELISIVSPRTFFRWLKGEKPREPPRATGRPRTAKDLRALVLRLATETGWGATRIHGELKKLGSTDVSRTTVANILRDAGFDPGPQRGEDTWNGFIQRHAKTLWACDFIHKKIWTLGGLVDYFILFFIHIGSRRVHITGFSANPSQAWTADQARAMAPIFVQAQDKPTLLLRDYDGKFSKEFDDVMKQQGIEVIPVGPHAPNLNAYAERFVLSIKSECLDHFIIFGEKHLKHILSEYIVHYLTERPHQGLDNKPLTDDGKPKPTAGNILCRERLAGLLKHYYREAA